MEVDPNLIVSRPDLSILDGASKWWGNLRSFKNKPNANWMKGEILALAEEIGIDLENHGMNCQRVPKAMHLGL